MGSPPTQYSYIWVSITMSQVAVYLDLSQAAVCLDFYIRNVTSGRTLGSIAGSRMPDVFNITIHKISGSRMPGLPVQKVALVVQLVRHDGGSDKPFKA